MKRLVALWVQDHYSQNRQCNSEHHKEHDENIATHLLVVVINFINLLDQFVYCRISRFQMFSQL